MAAKKKTPAPYIPTADLIRAALDALGNDAKCIEVHKWIATHHPQQIVRNIGSPLSTEKRKRKGQPLRTRLQRHTPRHTTVNDLLTVKAFADAHGGASFYQMVAPVAEIAGTVGGLDALQSAVETLQALLALNNGKEK